MDKLPLFGAYESFVMTAKKELKEAISARKWNLLVGYAILFLVTAAIILAGAISIIGGAIDYYQKWNPAPPPDFPRRTVSYQKTKETPNKYGQINTTFDIQIHTPFGNPNSNLEIRNSLPPDAECRLAIFNHMIQEIGAGLASTTNFAQANCTTTVPIIDNTSLFMIRG